jgi:hypothetical protein
LYARAVSHEEVVAALAAVDERTSDDQRREDLFVSALGYYVTELGWPARAPCRVRRGGDVIRCEPCQ